MKVGGETGREREVDEIFVGARVCVGDMIADKVSDIKEPEDNGRLEDDKDNKKTDWMRSNAVLRILLFA